MSGDVRCRVRCLQKDNLIGIIDFSPLPSVLLFTESYIKVYTVDAMYTFCYDEGIEDGDSITLSFNEIDLVLKGILRQEEGR